MSDTNTPSERLQHVKLTLSDGRVGWFAGRELVRESDQQANVKLVGIEFVEGQDLPEGCKFQNIERTEWANAQSYFPPR
jgi:hypothetical protein